MWNALHDHSCPVSGSGKGIIDLLKDSSLSVAKTFGLRWVGRGGRGAERSFKSMMRMS